MEETLGEKDKAILVAEYFILKNLEDPQVTGLSRLKLQKLIYYAQAWNLVVNNDVLFKNDIEAWIHGPVVPEVYYAFKEFDFLKTYPEVKKENFDAFSEDEKALLDEVWTKYGLFDGKYLENLTHYELPWQEARKDLEAEEPSKAIISVEIMKEYYGKRLEEAKERT